MKYLLPAGLFVLAAAILGRAAPSAQQTPPSLSDGPRFTAAGELIRPTDFREWIFVTSGLGMTYNEPTGAARARKLGTLKPASADAVHH